MCFNLFYHPSNFLANKKLDLIANYTMNVVNDYTIINNAYDDAVINGELTAELAADMESVSEDYKYWTSVRSAGWSMKTTNEIESIYKSMGVRLGLNVKF